MYWSTSNGNKLWQSRLDGSQAIPVSFHIDDVHTIGGLIIVIISSLAYIIISHNPDDIAIDWISSKLYWSENGLAERIRVLDLNSGYHMSLINTGQDTSPRAIIVDPINRYI